MAPSPMVADLSTPLALLKASIQQTRSAAEHVLRECAEFAGGGNNLAASLPALLIMFQHHCECLELLTQQIERDAF
jgi:hypothetical protein